MRTHRWGPLPLALVAFIGGLTTPGDTWTGHVVAPSDSLQPRVTVGSNVQITTARPAIEQQEFSVCADPRNARELVVGVMYRQREDTTLSNIGIYVSHDGGQTWRLSLDLPRSVDPAFVI